MDKAFERLPPLSALRGFEAAARLGSFSRAADELNMTQSAISHQIRLLEDFFRQPLFKRVGRSVQLTDAGRDFLVTARRSLEYLERGTRRLDSYQKPGSVIVTTTPAFAGKWLLPRFQELKTKHPDLEPWLYTTDEHLELEHAELDIAVWRGNGEWPGVLSVKLIDDWITPVGAPNILAAPLPEPSRCVFDDVTLLHDEIREDWHDWFRLNSVPRNNIRAGYNFSDSGLLLDSAIAGHGVALGSLVLAHDLIRKGALKRPFEQALPTDHAYYAVCVEANLRRPAVKQMWEWLIDRGIKFDALLKEDIAPLAEGNSATR